jgi:cytochrome P450
MGASSVLLLEGREHLTLRKAMLPPFHGERMRSYESIVREVAEREIASWPQTEPFALHPRMQAVTLEVILSAVFGVTDPQRRSQLRERLPLLLSNTSSVGLQLRFMLSRRLITQTEA